MQYVPIAQVPAASHQWAEVQTVEEVGEKNTHVEGAVVTVAESYHTAESTVEPDSAKQVRWEGEIVQQESRKDS